MKFYFKRNIQISVFYFLSQCFIGEIISQNQLLDSLLTTVKTEKQDTNYVKNLIKISNLYIQSSSYKDARLFAQQALTNAEKINYKKGIIKSYLTFSRVYIQSVNFDSAIFINKKLLSIVDSINDIASLANIYHDFGEAFYRKGDYNLSLYYFIKALKICELANNKEGMISCFTGVAGIYGIQKNNKKALEAYLQAEKLAQEIGNQKKLATIYNSIGIIYSDDSEKALAYFLKSLAIKEKIGNKQSIAISLGNIAEIYAQQKKYVQAISTFNKVLILGKEIGNKQTLFFGYAGLGMVYQSQNNLLEAEKYLKEGLKIAIEIRTKSLIDGAYTQLVELYEKKNDFKQALEYQKLHTNLKDSLFNVESNKQIIEMNTKYETEKKDKDLIKKDAEIAMQQVQTEKQAVIKNGFIIGFVFLLGLILFVYRGYIQKQKTNILLNEKNKKIMDSINYAKLIQNSILPPIEDVKKYLPETFVFYKPKDIVSGDFYWFYPVNEHSVILAVADCTGHGVPGAFMTMIGHSILSEIVVERKIVSPQQILTELHSQIFKKLQQHKGDLYSQDGMDISLVLIDKKENLLYFSGARNNAYLLTNNEVKTLKATQKSIGGLSILGEVEAERNFKIETCTINQDSLLVLSTDGFLDQFNSEDEKYGTKRFIETILNLAATNSHKSLETIENAYSSWRGNNPQQDDVLVFGVRI